MFTGETNLKDLPEIDELWHHGVKGQQWGIQNGPPYPLDKDGRAALKKQKELESKKQNQQSIDVEEFARSRLDWAVKSDLKFKKAVPEFYDDTDDRMEKVLSTQETALDFRNRWAKAIDDIARDWNENYSKPGWKKYNLEDPDSDNFWEEFFEAANSPAGLNNDPSDAIKFYSKFPEFMRDETFKHSDHLEHHGILGQKWGDQNGPPYPLNPSQKSYSEKKQARMDKKWVRKNDKKIRRYADSQSREELKAYEKELRKVMPKYNKNGKVNSNYATAYSKKMAELYNKAIGDLAVSSGSGSGKVVKFVAARGQMDVFTALADYGYDMSNVKNGVFDSGKIGYRKESVGVDRDERR